MAAGKQAVVNAQQMVKEVEKIGKSLGLKVEKRVKAGRTIWATDRNIKVVVEHASTRGKTKKSRVGIDCICQHGSGTAYHKFFSKAADIKKWPMDGIITYTGDGFTQEFKGVMDSYGSVPLNNLEQWLKTYYNMK